MLKKIDCPLCDEVHDVKLASRFVSVNIKGEEVRYEEKFLICDNTPEGENEFIPAGMMDANLLAARDAYRKLHGMLTSGDIVALRQSFGLTQKELSNLLGWGEATIARYESKLIQDATHDEILHVLREDALAAKDYLERNKDKFEDRRYGELTKIIDDKIEKTSKFYLICKALQATYSSFQGKADYTGGCSLDLEKACNIVAYFVQHSIQPLFKVKLMKLLWYADALYFKRYGVGMSGLVYQHKPMGALPVGHYELMSLLPYEEVIDFEHISYKLLLKEGFTETCFSKEELEVLAQILQRFNAFTGKDLAEYMHKEIAYQKTGENDYIPYSLAGLISLA